MHQAAFFMMLIVKKRDQRVHLYMGGLSDQFQTSA